MRQRYLLALRIVDVLLFLLQFRKWRYSLCDSFDTVDSSWVSHFPYLPMSVSHCPIKVTLTNQMSMQTPCNKIGQHPTTSWNHDRCSNCSCESFAPFGQWWFLNKIRTTTELIQHRWKGAHWCIAAPLLEGSQQEASLTLQPWTKNLGLPLCPERLFMSRSLERMRTHKIPWQSSYTACWWIGWRERCHLKILIYLDKNDSWLPLSVETNQDKETWCTFVRCLWKHCWELTKQW